jgi:hypothetical protein
VAAAVSGPGFKRAGGGPHDPAPVSFRVEITVLCPRGHSLVPFYRSTLPEREHEGVTYDLGRLLRNGATMTGAGPQWRVIRLRCGKCPADVQVSRAKLEERLAAMWAPHAKHRERVVWDSPDPPD